MFWLHRLQQRLSLTRNEAITLLVVAGLFAAGVIVRHIQQRAVPIASDAYDETDSLFFARAAAIREDTSRASSSGAPDSDGRSKGFSEAAPAIIDINRAALADLDRLPRIGPAIAQRIIDFRARFGPFTSVDNLLQVRGIGEKTLEQLRPLVIAGEDSTGN